MSRLGESLNYFEVFGKAGYEQYNAATKFGSGAKLDDSSPSYSLSENGN